PRLTKDIDVTLGATLERLAEVLTLVGEMELVPLVDPEVFTRETMVLPCQDPATEIRVDLIFSFSTYEQHALERARPVELGGASVRFASLEDVIIHKVIAGRPRDIEDVKSILVKNPQVDAGYIRKWLNDFVESLDEPFTDVFERVFRDSQ
ncbi:MAG: nucleotidyltransferase, partial [Anaerolineales bacterium]